MIVMNEQISELKVLVDRVGGEPWYGDGRGHVYTLTDRHIAYCVAETLAERERLGQFIAAARNLAVPLADEVEQLRGSLVEAQQNIKRLEARIRGMVGG